MLEGFLTESDEKRNSYASFQGGYDSGTSHGIAIFYHARLHFLL